MNYEEAVKLAESGKSIQMRRLGETKYVEFDPKTALPFEFREAPRLQEYEGQKVFNYIIDAMKQRCSREFGKDVVDSFFKECCIFAVDTKEQQVEHARSHRDIHQRAGDNPPEVNPDDYLDSFGLYIQLWPSRHLVKGEQLRLNEGRTTLDASYICVQDMPFSIEYQWYMEKDGKVSNKSINWEYKYTEESDKPYLTRYWTFTLNTERFDTFVSYVQNAFPVREGHSRHSPTRFRVSDLQVKSNEQCITEAAKLLGRFIQMHVFLKEHETEIDNFIKENAIPFRNYDYCVNRYNPERKFPTIVISTCFMKRIEQYLRKLAGIENHKKWNPYSKDSKKYDPTIYPVTMHIACEGAYRYFVKTYPEITNIEYNDSIKGE